MRFCWDQNGPSARRKGYKKTHQGHEGHKEICILSDRTDFHPPCFSRPLKTLATSSVAVDARDGRVGGGPARSYSDDSSKADGGTPNKQHHRWSEDAQARPRGDGPLSQRSKPTIQKPLGPEGGAVA
jgi:hypothetical protein